LTGGRLNESVCIRREITSCGLNVSCGCMRRRPRINVTCHCGIALKRLHKSNPGKPFRRRAIISARQDCDVLQFHSKACRKAAQLAKLSYGRTNGVGCHSLHHTFITDVMEARKQCGMVMSYSGHKSLESFKISTRPNAGMYSY
jgi:integrase